MSTINIVVPHKLSQEEATERIKGLLVKLKTEQAELIEEVKEKWDGNIGVFKFTAKGFQIEGDIQIEPSEVLINAKVPFVVSLFKGKITEVIQREAEKLLV